MWPHEVPGHLFDFLQFDQILDSKRGSAAELDEHHGRSHPLDRLKQIGLQATVSLTGGAVQVMLFDITTLYFESVDADVLRASGSAAWPLR